MADTLLLRLCDLWKSQGAMTGRARMRWAIDVCWSHVIRGQYYTPPPSSSLPHGNIHHPPQRLPTKEKRKKTATPAKSAFRNYQQERQWQQSFFHVRRAKIYKGPECVARLTKALAALSREGQARSSLTHSHSTALSLCSRNQD